MSASLPVRLSKMFAKTIAVSLTCLVTLSAGVAYAAWIAPGTGVSAARAATTGAGNAPLVNVSGRTATLTWPTSTYSSGVAVSSYLVKRYNAAGTVLQTIGSGTCATSVTGLGCSEAAVPPGSWKYTVTPAVGNWRGPESAQVAATVASPSLVLSPTVARATGTMSGTLANFVTGETVTFRLDSTTGTLLTGTLAGVATPTTVPVGGGGAVTVVLPAGTTGGAHSVVAVASPSAETASQAITVDNTPPPTPTITGGPTGTVSTTTATFTFTDTESPVTFLCKLDGGTATACTTGTSYSGLADGVHTFSVSAVDPAGNTGTAATRTWTVDTTGPVIAITWPVAGSSYNATDFIGGCGGGAIDVCGTASDVSGVATVRISLQQVATGRYWNGTGFTSATEVMLMPTGTTSWSYTLAVGVAPAEGSYTLRVYATDTLAKPSSAISTFVYDDTAPPTPAITSSPALDTNSTTAVFAFSDTEAGVAFTCSLDGAPDTSCTSPKTYLGLAEGTHTFTVTASDAAGNSASRSYTWDLDVTAPTGVITAPVNGSSYNTASYNALCGTANLCGTAVDNLSGVQTKQVSVQSGSGNYWNGTAFASATEVRLATTGAGATWNYVLAAASLPDGTYTARLYVTDLATNVSSATVSTWTMDRVAPATPLITGGPTGTVTTRTATFTFTDTDPSATFLCALDGGAASACVSGKTYTALGDGSHTVTVSAIDAAGNTSTTATRTWTVDGTGPTNTFTFPVDGSAYNAAKYNAGCGTPTTGDLCGTTSDTNGVASVRVTVQQDSSGLYWTGTGFTSAVAVPLTPTGTTSWTYALATGAAFPDGSYTVVATATDTPGNVSTSTSTFTLDQVAPSGSPLSTTNAGTTGRAEQGDSITFTTSEQLAPWSLLPAWTGSSTNVVVRITNGPGSDVLTVWNAANSVQVALGSVNLGASYVTASVTYGLSGTASTMVQNGSAITVTLGRVSATGSLATAPGFPDMTWTPSSTATDLAGNPMPTTTIVETDNDKDF